MNTMKRRAYERGYAKMQGRAADWSVAKLKTTIEQLMARHDKPEGTWGAIDALADLLCRIVLPVGRQVIL
jgi:hypothetical protein